MLPGESVYFDETTGKSGVRPIYEVKPDAQLLLEDIKETQERIKSVCFEDVFQMLSSMEETPQKTAVEIQARMQEKMLVTFHRINRCGYYTHGAKDPTFGSIDDLLDQLQEWSQFSGRF